LRGVLLGTLALAGCHEQPPSAVVPPSDPPSGEIRPDAPIPYDILVEHLRFNTRSRMRGLMLQGQVIQVHGPVWRVECEESVGAVLHLGTPQGSLVRAHIAGADDLRDIRKGQEVDVVGTFDWRGREVILKDAHLKK
jgi:hypothetical protein